jgi:putative ABC transport system ATP-binding protein
MVTHDPRILDIADRLVRMEDGRLQEGERVGAAATVDDGSPALSSR